MKPPLSCDRSFLRLFASPALAIASLLAFDRAAAQAPTWQVEMAKADADYDDAMEKLSERRRTAVQKAGETWIKSITAEVVEATRAGDNTLARGLQAKIAAAREAGRVPLARPTVVEFDRHEYALIEDPKTWMEAKEHCERMGGHLLILDDAKEEAFILSNLAKIGFWVGATDLGTPGRTAWIDGTPFRKFAANVQFDNFQNRENGVSWSVRAKCWNDFSDGVRMPYVCEWE